MSLRGVLLAATIFSWLGGCHSTFEARKLGPNDEIKAGDGIPYVLTRAEPRLTRMLKDGKPAYDLSIVHVPDPDQRYTLRVSPSLIADVDFSLSFDDDGTLKTVDAVATERITPTITAVGSVLAGAMSVLAFEDTEKPRVQFAIAFAERVMNFSCASGIRDQIIGLVRTIEEEVLTWENADPSIDPDATFKALFYIESAPQKKCLDDLAKYLEQQDAAMLRGDEQEPNEEQQRAQSKDIIAFIKTVRVYGLAERHAHLAAKLQRELQQAMRLQALKPDENYDVEGKREALARAVGKGAEFKQLKKLEKALADGPPAPGRSSSSYEEYARIREQAKALRTETADAVGEALSSLSPPALKPFAGVPVPIVHPDCVKAKVGDKDPREGKNCPNDKEFVVVLERAPGSGGGHVQTGDEK